MTLSPLTSHSEHHNNFCPLVMRCFERYKEQRLDEKCALLPITIKIKKENCLLSLLNTTHCFNRYFALRLVLDYRLDDWEIGLQISADIRTYKKCVLFFTVSKQALELTQPHIQWVTNVLSSWVTRPWVKIMAHLHVMLRLRMRGAVTPLDYIYIYILVEWWTPGLYRFNTVPLFYMTIVGLNTVGIMEVWTTGKLHKTMNCN